MSILRTPEARFENLADFPFQANYTDIEHGSQPLQMLRMHHVEAGPKDASPVLMLHGEPTWSYLYRKMIPIIADAGYRAVAPDFIGFGRSDKLSEIEDYSYQRHIDWTKEWLLANDLRNITLICQDWGGLIGLRLVAEMPERFAAVVAANTGLPTGDRPMPEIWEQFRTAVETAPNLSVSRLVQSGCLSKLSSEELAAYDAPFPDDSYKAGVRSFPNLVPRVLVSRALVPRALVPRALDDPAREANQVAWQKLMKFEKPFLTAFSDSDPITKGGDRLFQKLIPGTKEQDHTTIVEAGHFLQEDKGEELAKVVVDFLSN